MVTAPAASPPAPTSAATATPATPISTLLYRAVSSVLCEPLSASHGGSGGGQAITASIF